MRVYGNKCQVPYCVYLMKIHLLSSKVMQLVCKIQQATTPFNIAHAHVPQYHSNIYNNISFRTFQSVGFIDSFLQSSSFAWLAFHPNWINFIIIVIIYFMDTKQSLFQLWLQTMSHTSMYIPWRQYRNSMKNGSK